MIKISACILAKNEEENIAECIKSVRPFVDEIIVVDNGSEDNTKNIAKSLGCIVLNGNNLLLDSARELYLKQAKYDWILILDADERFESLSQISLREFLSKSKNDIWGYDVLSYQHLGLGKWAEIYILRLIRNNKMIHYNKSPIHSSMAPSIYNHHAKIENTCLFAIHHLDILIEGRPVSKRKRYRSLLEEILTNGNNDLNKDMKNLYKCFLGLEYIAIGLYDKAEKLYLDVSDESFRYQDFAMQCLCQLYMYVQQYEKVKEYITPRNIIYFSNTAVLGNYYNYFDKKKAIEYYEEMIENNPLIASNYLNLAYLLKNSDINRAKELLKNATKKNSYLLKKLIYNIGEKQNIFFIQSSILFQINNIYELFEELEMTALIDEEQ